MKSDLQVRAERAAERFADSARKPIVIEFAGVPKAGKTSTLGQLQSFLKRCGFRVEVVIERASVCPIRDKKHSNFNVWTAATTLAQILEKTQNPPRPEDPHILILDRGLFDAINWFTLMERLERVRAADRKVIERFLLLDDWRERISGVIVMTASPQDAMEREKGFLPVETQGSIMNTEVLQRMLDITLDTVDRLRQDFRVYTIDTSFGDTKNNPCRTAEIVADIVLSLIEEHLQEDILCIPKEELVTTIFQGKTTLNGPDALLVSEAFNKSGTFRPRGEVEEDESLLQALPVVVVRNKSGDVLRLRRREKSEQKKLHEEIVVWAGGHVRKEDSKDGDALVQCALRELQEELRLNLEAKDLSLLGAVYADIGDSTSKHVAIVYGWTAETDDVTVALSSAEFFERRGTSLSGKFVKLDELAKDVDENKLGEIWSAEIIRELLAQNTFEFKKGLF